MVATEVSHGSTSPLADVDRRIREAVGRFAATDPNPLDPFRGLYITDEQAQGLASAPAPAVFDGRLEVAARRLGLDAVDAAVLAACAAPQLSPRYGRLY